MRKYYSSKDIFRLYFLCKSSDKDDDDEYWFSEINCILWKRLKN